ncbi:hypothetical protein LIA77_04742 [Sarocladium implicatum]|nr:hypothetical protein LIA77_04742 [Sarocladium implicatum]
MACERRACARRYLGIRTLRQASPLLFTEQPAKGGVCRHVYACPCMFDALPWSVSSLVPGLLFCRRIATAIILGQPSDVGGGASTLAFLQRLASRPVHMISKAPVGLLM